MTWQGKAKLLAVLITGVLSGIPVRAGGPDPTTLIREAFHRWRGDSSYTEVTMTIHRPDWERTLAMVAWTRGEQDSLVRFTQPAGDAGNATLKLGQALWLFNPKLNQVIKLPFSMMSQNWMGSDFSYNDFAKSDEVVTDYTHRLEGTTREAGHEVFTVACLPKPGAPVVWGKQTLRIREDGVLLEETFFDQDMKPIRRMETTRVAPLGGRPYPVVMRITSESQPDHWTEMRYTKGVFGITLPAGLFTLSNLQNPRPWRLR